MLASTMLAKRRKEKNSKGSARQNVKLRPLPSRDQSNQDGASELPVYNHNGHKVAKGIQPDGESGRKGFHPWQFVKICCRSTSPVSQAVNLLWPFVPVALAFHFARPNLHLWIFALNYIAMVPTANLVGFAGQELARKIPKVIGVILETFLGSIVEIVLFMVLLHNSNIGKHSLIPVIQAAILGSILTNLLLCVGMCFFVGGIWREEQEFHEAISEVGSGLLLVAGFGLLVPSAFYTALSGRGSDNDDVLRGDVLMISRATSVILLVAFVLYVWFQVRTHNGIYADILEQDERKDTIDHNKELKKDKLTFTECIVALVIALTCVSMHAVFLAKESKQSTVQEVDYIKHNVSDSFLGLILVPLVEKFAEHLSAIDEAYDNRMNFALAHVLGATIQTALLNSSLVVLVGWGLGKPMDLNFEIFMVVCLILAILVVGNFLRDGKSNYLEGGLCVLVYCIIAITTWYYPGSAADTNDGVDASEGGANITSGSKRFR